MVLPNDEGKRTGMDTRVRCPLCAETCLFDLNMERLVSGSRHSFSAWQLPVSALCCQFKSLDSGHFVRQRAGVSSQFHYVSAFLGMRYHSTIATRNKAGTSPSRFIRSVSSTIAWTSIIPPWTILDQTVNHIRLE